MKTDKLKSSFLGVFWVDVSSNKVYSDKIPISQGQEYGKGNKLLVYPKAHYDLWETVRKMNHRWCNLKNYEDAPRGRVAACMENPQEARFLIVMSSTLHTAKIKKAVLLEFNLPSAEFLTDEHYEKPDYI